MNDVSFYSVVHSVPAWYNCYDNSVSWSTTLLLNMMSFLPPDSLTGSVLLNRYYDNVTFLLPTSHGG